MQSNITVILCCALLLSTHSDTKELPKTHKEATEADTLCFVKQSVMTIGAISLSPQIYHRDS